MKGFGNIERKERQPVITSATRQARQRWFSVGIFPLGLLFGLTGNRLQSTPTYNLLLCRQLKSNSHISMIKIFKLIIWQ